MTPPEVIPPSTRSRNDNFKRYYEQIILSEDDESIKNWFRRLKEVINRKCPKAVIIIGGTKAQSFIIPPLNEIAEIDYVVIGSVDHVFPQIIQDIIHKGQAQVLYGKVIDTVKTYIQSKNCPSHTWSPDFCVQPNEALPIEISRGCAFNCKFCHYEKKQSNRKSIEDLKAEMIFNYENFGTQFYHFLDDCFNDSRQKVEEVCQMILSLPFPIEWVSYARFDVAVKFPETADLMVRAGAKGLYFGIESFTYEVARRAGKGTPPEKVKQFLQEFRSKYKDQCLVTGSFISGLPGETEESWNRELNWLLENPCMDFVSAGALGIASYKAELDQTAVDYAEYARNPKAYGFEEIRFSPPYWRHATMDLPKAEELAENFAQSWQKRTHEGRVLINNIWQFPYIRSFGLSVEETRDFYFSTDPEIKSQILQKASTARNARVHNYFADLRKVLKT